MAAELLDKYRFSIESLTMLPSSGGRFEIIVDDDLVYSKKATGRHAEPGEVARLFSEKTGAKPAVM